MIGIIRASLACVLSTALSTFAQAAFIEPDVVAALAPPIMKVVVFGEDARLTPDQYAEKNHLDAADVKRRHAASGVIHCGNARGAGQLTLSDSVITTAAHVLFDETGRLRADSSRCYFTASVGGVDVSTSIDLATVVSGNTSPYAAPAVHDWAVARLMRPINGATPYKLGGSAQTGDQIRFVARGHSDWGAGKAMSMEKCGLRSALSVGAEGTREFAFDCDAGVGASGGALLKDASGCLVAVFVGYRSVAPDSVQAFSNLHYNFAVSVDGAFRRAVELAASQAPSLSSQR
jgi:hypothetical protein